MRFDREQQATHQYAYHVGRRKPAACQTDSRSYWTPHSSGYTYAEFCRVSVSVFHHCIIEQIDKKVLYIFSLCLSHMYMLICPNWFCLQLLAISMFAFWCHVMFILHPSWAAVCLETGTIHFICCPSFKSKAESRSSHLILSVHFPISIFLTTHLLWRS